MITLSLRRALVGIHSRMQIIRMYQNPQGVTLATIIQEGIPPSNHNKLIFGNASLG